MTIEDPLMDDEQAGEAVARYLEENPELLDGVVPAHDLWPAIESRISARVIPISAAPRAARRAVGKSLGWMPMLIAASALIASSAGITYVLTMRAASHAAQAGSVASATTPSPVGPTRVATDTNHAAQNVTQPRATVAANSQNNDRNSKSGNDAATSAIGAPVGTRHGHASAQLASHSSTGGNDEIRKTYDSEIATLHAALEARRGQLNPSTVEIIEQNLRVIDDAIEQSRAALAKDPNSRLLNDQLDRTLAKKTGLLRAAALLPAA